MRPFKETLATLKPAIGLASLVFILYSYSVDSWWFVDDYLLLSATPERHIFAHWLNPGFESVGTGFYRPLEMSLLSLFNYCFGDNTIPYRLLIMTMHIAVCFAAVRLGTRLGLEKRAAWLAGFMMALAQTNVMVVTGLDTLSQAGSTLTMLLGLTLLVGSSVASAQNQCLVRRSGYWQAVFLFVIGLTLKETSVAFVPMAILTMFVYAVKSAKTTFKEQILSVFVGSLPLVFILLSYMVLRAYVNVVSVMDGNSYYSLSFGVNIIKNLGMLMYSTISPFSAVALMDAHASRNLAVLAMTGIAPLLLAPAAMGWWKGRLVPKATFLLALACSSLSPVLLLTHVSELYSYSAAPFVYLAFSAGLLALAGPRLTDSSWWAKGATLALAAWCAISGWQVMQKSAQATSNSLVSRSVFGTIQRSIEVAEPESVLCLEDKASCEPHYSVFRLCGLRLVLNGLPLALQRAGRTDVRIVTFEGDGSPGPGNASGEECDTRVVLDNQGARVEPHGLPGI